MFQPPVIDEAAIAHLQSLYPETDFKLPTAQQNQALVYYFRGYTVAAAAKHAGYTTPLAFSRFLKTDAAKAIVEHVRQEMFQDINISKELLTSMLLDAHAKSANSTEEIAAIRELGKLHAVYPDAKNNGLTININKAATNIKQLQRMDDSQLIELAGVDWLEQFTDDKEEPEEEDPIESFVVEDKTLDV